MGIGGEKGVGTGRLWDWDRNGDYKLSVECRRKPPCNKDII